MSGLPFLAVFGGAGLGALLRWWLGGWLNPIFPTPQRSAPQAPIGRVIRRH